MADIIYNKCQEGFQHGNKVLCQVANMMSITDAMMAQRNWGSSELKLACSTTMWAQDVIFTGRISHTCTSRKAANNTPVKG
jgi:hypothetical protein